MMNIRFVAIALALGVVSAAASAQTIWNFNDQSSPGSCASSSATGIGNTYNCTSQPSGTTTSLVVTAWGTGTTAGSNYAAANLAYYSGNGIGVRSAAEIAAVGGNADNVAAPDHAMDNNISQEMMLLNFTTGAAALKQLTLGYWSNDSDVSVLRWTGTGAPTDAGANNLAGQSVTTLLTHGWSLVSNLSNIGTTTTSFNSGGLTSSYWLVSAFNSAFGAGDTTADYVKLYSVGATQGTTTTPVPEPTSIALVALALFGLAGSRRFVKRA